MAGSGDQIKNLFKWRHLFAKFATNSSGATEINLELFKLKDLLKIWSQYPGSFVPLAMFFLQICFYKKINILIFFIDLKKSIFNICDVIQRSSKIL